MANGKSKNGNKFFERLKPGIKAVLKVLLVLLIAVSLVFIAARSIGGVTLNSITGNIKVVLSNIGSGDGYPYDTSGAQIASVYLDGSKVFAFSKGKTFLLSASAKELNEADIEYGKPAIKYKNGKAIVYDRDSGKFRVQNTSEIIAEKEMKKNITAAGIGKKGNCAVATGASGAQSQLTVFDKSQKEAFTWTFKDERVSDIDLSDDGKFAVVSTIVAENAQINSKVYVFRFDSKDYVACFDYDDNAVVSVQYVESHNICVISDKMRSFITDNTTRVSDDAFDSDVLHRRSDDDSVLNAVALLKYGSDSSSILKVYKDDELLFTQKVGSEIKDVSCSDKYVAVLTDSKVTVYNKKGELKAEFSADVSDSYVLVGRKRVYTVSPSAVSCNKF